MQLVLKGYSLAIRDAFRFEKKYLEFSVFPLYFGQIVIKNRRYKKGPKSYILAKHEKKKPLTYHLVLVILLGGLLR